MKKIVGMLLVVCFMLVVVGCVNPEISENDSPSESMESSNFGSDTSFENSTGNAESNTTNNPFAGGLVNGGTYEENKNHD